jgi:hypothetical protein
LQAADFNGRAWLAPRTVVDELNVLNGTPRLLVDGAGWVHAFWQLENPGGALVHSQMPITATAWVTTTIATESAMSFDVALDSNGGVSLAYLRSDNTEDLPAGVYVRTTPGEGVGWSAPVAVYTTIYFRLLTPETAYIRLAAGEQDVLLLAWEDPRRGQSLFAASKSGGQTWSQPEPLGSAEQRPRSPRLAAFRGAALRLWQASSQSGCALYQQAASNYPSSLVSWQEPQRALESLATCPQGDQFWPVGDGLLWIWGQGAGALSLAAWDAVEARWSLPRNLSFNFDNPESGQPVSLSDLHAALAGDYLVVVGSDAAGEVWATLAQTGALDLAFAPPSPWLAVQRLSPDDRTASEPAAAIDRDGRTHVVWSQASGGGLPTALAYARWDGQALSRSVEIVQAGEGELVRHPALLADAQGHLHLVWSGGAGGEILYSRANLGEAASAGGWLPPQPLFTRATAAWPQIGMDAAGRLYVLYSVPLNEGRGVYGLYSEDGGDTWSPPELVFDAAAAGWAMVDHPALAVAPDGMLLATWVQKALPDTWPPQQIVFARGALALVPAAAPGGEMTPTPGGDSETPSPEAPPEMVWTMVWGQPVAVAGVGYDWPRLILSNGQVHLLYAQIDGGEALLGQVWQRHLSLMAQNGDAAWSTAAQVPGWQSVGLPYGVAMDGYSLPVEGAPGSLYLVGLSPADGMILYSAWAGERWSSAESFRPENFTGFGLAAAAATRLEGGALAVAWVGYDTDPNSASGLAGVYLAVRSIPTLELPPMPTQQPTPAPTAAPTPQVTATLSPTSTPDLNWRPAPEQTPFSPLLLGGVLAGALVGMLFTVVLLRRKPGRVR